MTAPAKLVLTLADLAELGLPFSRGQIAALERDGKFPRRIQLGLSKTCWLASQVYEWIEQAAARAETDATSRAEKARILVATRRHRSPSIEAAKHRLARYEALANLERKRIADLEGAPK
jgi:predicted DNA-binding transcriptional regulator AlpA